MGLPNYSKRFSWAYEAVAGTADDLKIAASTSYYFGIYNDDVQKWNYPTITNKIANYNIYNTRNPVLVNDGASMPQFTHTYIPTSAQHLVWQKGAFTGDDPISFDPAAYNKEQYAISIRGEQGDGDDPQFMQLNGCFSTRLYGSIEAGSPYVVEQTWSYMNYADQREGGYAQLTTPPVVPDSSSTPYIGLPTVTYDYDSGNVNIPNVIKFDYTDEAVYSKAYTNTTETAQVIYKERFKPVQFTITAIFEVDTFWDDFIDRTGTKELRVELFKADVTEYITLDFTNIRIEGYSAEGEGFEGNYTTTLVGKAEALSGEASNQGTVGTHFKGETT